MTGPDLFQEVKTAAAIRKKMTLRVLLGCRGAAQEPYHFHLHPLDAHLQGLIRTSAITGR